jgi:uncharacterized membrane protein
MKSINNEAPVKYSKSITINASINKVWSVLTDINNWSSWQTDIKKPKLNGELQPQSTFEWKTGGVKIHSTLQNVDTNKQFGWSGKSLGIFAIHNWILSENENSTTIKVEESMEGFMAKLMKNSLNQKLDSSLQIWLDLLKEESEKRMN